MDAILVKFVLIVSYSFPKKCMRCASLALNHRKLISKCCVNILFSFYGFLTFHLFYFISSLSVLGRECVYKSQNLWFGDGCGGRYEARGSVNLRLINKMNRIIKYKFSNFLFLNFQKYGKFSF